MNLVARSADISPCGRYRYLLARQLPGMFGTGTCLFVMLNPSTADGSQDDQTIRQCMGFAQHWGFDRLLVVNLFAWRATIPADMLAAIDPVGPDADGWIKRSAREAQRVVCAWGSHGKHRGRGDAVRTLLRQQGHTLHHLGLTRDGQPKHPLYLARETALKEWT